MSEVEFGRLGYGAANVGNLYHAMSEDEAHTVLEAAWENGIRYFDTAPHYGLGLSERRLGAFLSTKPREEFVVSTKVGRLLRPYPEGAGSLDTAHDFAVPADLRREWDFSVDGVRRSLEESLERLGLERVDVVYLHDPERFDLQEGLHQGLPAAAALREEGLVRAVGVGSMVTETLLESACSGTVDLLMVAGRLTLVDQSVAEDVLPACSEHRVDVVAAAVFNSGLLASGSPSTDSRFDYRPVPAELLDRTRRIAQVCESFDVSLPVAALHFPLQHHQVVSVVVGGADAQQVRENVERLALDVPDEMWARLRDEGLVTL